MEDKIVLHPERGTNILQHYKIRKGDVEVGWAEADVVVEGGLEADGTFDATLLLAKCPSKYESSDGADTAQSYSPAPERAANP